MTPTRGVRLLVPILALGVALVAAWPLPTRAQDSSTDLARQLQVRSSLGLSVDPALVSQIATDPAADTTSLGIPVTAAELANLRARPTGQDVAPVEAFGAANPDIFGGLYIDQAAGGVVDVAFTRDVAVSAARVAPLLSSSFGIQFRTVAWTETQLRSAVQAITAQLPTLGNEGLVISEVSPDIVSNRVDVFVSSDVSAAAARLNALFGPIVNVASQPPIQPATCSRANCPPPWRGGLQITSTDSACTSGYIAKTGGGGLWYMITAGHCNEDGLDVNWSNGAGSIGPVARTAFHDYSSADALAIAITPSKRSNYYFTTSVPAQTITSWAVQPVGELICKSGVTTGVSCGSILAVGVTEYYLGKHFTDQVRAAEAVQRGDSGAPVFDFRNDHQLLGTVTAFDSEFVTYYSITPDENYELTTDPCFSLSC